MQKTLPLATNGGGMPALYATVHCICCVNLLLLTADVLLESLVY